MVLVVAVVAGLSRGQGQRSKVRSRSKVKVEVKPPQPPGPFVSPYTTVKSRMTLVMRGWADQHSVVKEKTILTKGTLIGSTCAKAKDEQPTEKSCK